MADAPLARSRPTRLVSIGVGRDDRRPIPLGHAHQCTTIPAYIGAFLPHLHDLHPSPQSHTPIAVPLDVLEKEYAKGVGEHLTRAAYAPVPADPRYYHGAHDNDDSRAMQPLIDAGVLKGVGTSSYIPNRPPLQFLRSKPGMLACEVRPAGAPASRSGSGVAGASSDGAVGPPPPRPPPAKIKRAPANGATAGGVRTPEVERAALIHFLAQCGGDASLVGDWRVTIEERKLGNTAGQTDVYWFSPGGKKFRSRGEVARYLGLAAAPPPKKKAKKAVAWDPAEAT